MISNKRQYDEDENKLRDWACARVDWNQGRLPTLGELIKYTLPSPLGCAFIYVLYSVRIGPSSSSVHVKSYHIILPINNNNN